VYGVAASIGKNIAVGNAAGGTDLEGVSHVKSFTFIAIQITYSVSESGVKQFGAGLAAGLSYSKYDTVTASSPTLGTEAVH
jgi:hypothetical protein